MVLSFSEATAQAVQGAACSLLALSDEGTRWINSAIGADGDFGNIAGALRKNVCNESDPTGDYGPDVPFTGGQCPGVEYNVRIRRNSYLRRRCDNGSTFDVVIDNFTSVDCYGPVLGLRDEPSAQGDCGASGRQVFLDAFDSNGDPLTATVYTVSLNPTAFAIDSVDIEIFEITRNDGQPDNCGDPEGTVSEYNDYSETVSITYEDNSETEITEDIDITLGPLIVGIGGILYAPVTIGTGDIDISGQVVLAPELSVDLWPDGLFGGGGNTDNPAPDPGEPDPEPTVSDERRRIIGAIVTVTNFDEDIARVTQVAQDDSPDIFVPRTGNVSFYIDTPGGQAWTEPTPLRNVRQYVPCPAREGAVDVAVTEGTGFTLAVTPVYADLAVI